MPTVLEQTEREFDLRVQALDLFDACAWVGRPTETLTCFPTGTELRAALSKWGISGALVTHAMSVHWDARHGNEALVRELADLPGCHGTMTLLPPSTGELGDVGKYVDDMIAQGIRAARLFPNVHRFSMHDPSLPDLFRLLEERRVPLVMWIGQSSWDELAALAQAFPRLPIIVDGVGHHECLNARTYLGHIERHPNLFVELHSMLWHGGLEEIVRRIGPERVLFGTNLPDSDPAAPMMLITHSELDQAQRKLVAGDNLRRLIAGVTA